jgi:hypothetical protein
VERTFSFKRDYVSVRRHSLHPKLVSQGMVLLFYSKNNIIKPLVLHEYMTKKKDSSKTQVKERAARGRNVMTID